MNVHILAVKRDREANVSTKIRSRTRFQKSLFTARNVNVHVLHPDF